MESGKNFNVGSGLTDKTRQELTRDGVPRFPSFVDIAIDKDACKDAVIPEHRKMGAGAGGEEA